MNKIIFETKLEINLRFLEYPTSALEKLGMIQSQNRFNRLAYNIHKKLENLLNNKTEQELIDILSNNSSINFKITKNK